MIKKPFQDPLSYTRIHTSVPSHTLSLFTPYHCNELQTDQRREDIWPPSSGCRLCFHGLLKPDYYNVTLQDKAEEMLLRTSARCFDVAPHGQSYCRVISAAKTATDGDRWFKDCYRWTLDLRLWTSYIFCRHTAGFHSGLKLSMWIDLLWEK